MPLKLKRYGLRAIICCAIGLLLAVLGPSLVAVFWHATHKSVQRFDKLNIPVPFSFVALSRRENGINLLRAKPVFSSSFYQFESIQITKHEGQVSLDKWRASALRSALGDGYGGVKAYDLQLGDLPMACVERVAGGSQVHTTVLCANDGDIYVQYFGDAPGISDMRELLQKVRRSNQ